VRIDSCPAILDVNEMRSKTEPVSINRRLVLIMSLLVLGTALVLAVSGWFLFLSPSLDRIALSRIDGVDTSVKHEFDRLFQQTQRLLHNTKEWIEEDQFPLEPSGLNRRFIPVLEQFPELSLVLIAETSGRALMLRKQKDGTWLNQLTPPGDRRGSAQFLTWENAGQLISDETRPDDYDPRKHPWFTAAIQAPPGQPVWTELYSFHDDKQLGVTAAIRIPHGKNGDLVFALDLRLEDMAKYLADVKTGQQSLAVLLANDPDASILGMTSHNRLLECDELPECTPLKQGRALWIRGNKQPIEVAQLRIQGELWYLGFRQLHLGDHELWLGVYLPTSELIPGLGYQSLVLTVVLLLAIALVIGLAVLFARAFSRPLEALAANSERIGNLDFALPPPIRSDLKEIRQLADVQERMRGMLKDALEKLAREQQALQKAQSQLIHAAKLESVGRLAAGVAHEVKNPLTTILQGLDLLKTQAGMSDMAINTVSSMERAIRRADKVINGLWKFSGKRELNLSPADLNQIIRDSLDLVRHELQTRNIALSESLSPLPPIPLDRDKLQQVFINLFMNAIQAMNKDGTLTIVSEARKLNLENGLGRDCSGRVSEGECAIWVEVRDSGDGIESEQPEQLFEPFFTTKAVGEGTGLGLSVSREIVELHQGSIDLRNHPQGGTSVTLLFKLEGA